MRSNENNSSLVPEMELLLISSQNNASLYVSMILNFYCAGFKLVEIARQNIKCQVSGVFKLHATFRNKTLQEVILWNIDKYLCILVHCMFILRSVVTVTGINQTIKCKQIGNLD